MKRLVTTVAACALSTGLLWACENDTPSSTTLAPDGSSADVMMPRADGSTSDAPASDAGNTPDATDAADATADADAEAEVGFTVGYPVDLGSSSIHGANFLFGFKVTVPRPLTLLKLCVISRRAGVNGKLALYSNVSNNPSALIANTDAFVTTVGRMELSPATPTTLAAGDYWLFGVYDAEMSIAQSAVNFEEDSRYRGQTVTAPLPDPFGTAGTEQAQKPNYYLRLED